LDRALHSLTSFDWILFTSPNGVEAFFNRLATLGFDLRELKGLQIGDIGPATDEALKGWKLRADLVPEKFQAEYEELATGNAPVQSERTHEYGTYIMEAMETNNPTRVNGNVPNRGLVTNLPEGCCVEVPCLVDANGVQPTYVGALPTQLAAVNRTNVNVQELIVEAALTGKKDAVYHAVMLDPLTAQSPHCPRSMTW
jgi:alpha-galactosidase